MKKLLITLITLFSMSGVWGQSIEDILRKVEANNKELQAYHNLMTAQQLETKTDKYLSNPEVEYEHMWGNQSPAVSQGELTVSQAFDFPSAYTNRNRITKLRFSLYDYEQVAFRQQLLLDAKRLCLEIVSLQKQKDLLDEQLQNTTQMANAYKAKYEAGDATVVEYNKTMVELISARTNWGMNNAELSAKLEELSNMTGENISSLSGMEYPITQSLNDFSGLLEYHIENNPELRGLEQEVEINRKNIALNRSLSLPKFELGYRLDFGEGHRFNGIKAGMSIPLFENKNKVKLAKAQTLYAESKLESERRVQTSNLRKLYDQTKTLEETVIMARQLLPTHDNLELLKKSLAEGQISIIEYYTEAQQVYNDRQMLLNVEYQYQDLMAQLYRFAL